MSVCNGIQGGQNEEIEEEIDHFVKPEEEGYAFEYALLTTCQALENKPLP